MPPPNRQTEVLPRSPGGGTDVVHRSGAPAESWRLWLEGEPFPRLVLDPTLSPASVLVGDGTAAPTPLSVSGGAAPSSASFVTGVAEAGLSAELVLGTKVIMAGTLAARPGAGTVPAGALYETTDTRVVYRSDGVATWDIFAAGLTTGGLVPTAQVGSGTSGVTKQLRGDSAWVDSFELVMFSKQGVLGVTTGQLRFRVKGAYAIVEVNANVGTAPTGASIIVDVLRNGTSIFNVTPANRPTIAVTTNTAVSGPPDVTALADGDFLTVNIVQIGSVVIGSDLTVGVVVRR